MLFGTQILEMLKVITIAQDEILDRMKKLENQVNEDYLSVQDAAKMIGCSPQNIYYHLEHNHDIEPEKDWIVRNGKKQIRKNALTKIRIKSKKACYAIDKEMIKSCTITCPQGLGCVDRGDHT